MMLESINRRKRSWARRSDSSACLRSVMSRLISRMAVGLPCSSRKSDQRLVTTSGLPFAGDMLEFAFPLPGFLDHELTLFQRFRELGLQQVVGNLADGLLSRPSIEVPCSAVPEKYLAVQTAKQDRVVRQVEQGGLFPYFLLRALVVAQVGGDQANPLLGVFQRDRTKGQLHRKHGPVRAQQVALCPHVLL